MFNFSLFSSVDRLSSNWKKYCHNAPGSTILHLHCLTLREHHCTHFLLGAGVCAGRSVPTLHSSSSYRSVPVLFLSSESGPAISQQRWSHRTLLPSWRLLTTAGSLWATMADQAPAWGLDRPIDNKGGLWIGGPVGSRCKGNKAGQGQIKSAEGNTAQG